MPRPARPAAPSGPPVPQQSGPGRSVGSRPSSGSPGFPLPRSRQHQAARTAQCCDDPPSERCVAAWPATARWGASSGGSWNAPVGGLGSLRGLAGDRRDAGGVRGAPEARGAPGRMYDRAVGSLGCRPAVAGARAGGHTAGRAARRRADQRRRGLPAAERRVHQGARRPAEPARRGRDPRGGGVRPGGRTAHGAGPDRRPDRGCPARAVRDDPRSPRRFPPRTGGPRC